MSPYENWRIIEPCQIAVTSSNHLPISLFALDFYKLIVDGAEGRINFHHVHLIETESETSDCFSRILTHFLQVIVSYHFLCGLSHEV